MSLFTFYIVWRLNKCDDMKRENAIDPLGKINLHCLDLLQH